MDKERNIVIIGMPGSGKTTFGKALAAKLQREFIDADDFIEAQEGRTIKDMFTVSEECFRDAETRASKALAAKKGLVVACGGGVIKRPVNIEVMKQTGTIIFIDRDPDAIVGDVEVSTRPLLAAGKQRVYDLYKERIDLYRAAADHTIKNDKPEADVLADLITLVESL